jgi:hypothetical protein
MTVDQLRTAFQARPFIPFVMHLADGRNLPVSSPEFILTTPSGRTVAVAQPDDTVHVIDILMVTDLEFQSAENGRRKRGRRQGR